MASRKKTKHFQSFVSTTPWLPVLNGTLWEVTMLAHTLRVPVCIASFGAEYTK